MLKRLSKMLKKRRIQKLQKKRIIKFKKRILNAQKHREKMSKNNSLALSIS